MICKGEVCVDNTNDLVYFELNNWFAGRDYPPEEPIASWVEHYWGFHNDEFCKKNKLVVLEGNIDMSVNFCIIAQRKWVEDSCPVLLSGKEYTYKIIRSGYDKDLGKIVEKEIIQSGNMNNFLRYPDDDGDVYGRFGWRFPEYTEENIGNTYYECEGE